MKNHLSVGYRPCLPPKASDRFNSYPPYGSVAGVNGGYFWAVSGGFWNFEHKDACVRWHSDTGSIQSKSKCQACGNGTHNGSFCDVCDVRYW